MDLGTTPPPQPLRRQDTPTAMFVQEVHGAPATLAADDDDDDDDDDGGRTAIAAAPSEAAAAPAPRMPRPELPVPGRDDDKPTSVIDLEALTAASRRKAAAGTAPATTPPPPMSRGATPGPDVALPDLAPLGSAPVGPAPLGAPRSAPLGGIGAGGTGLGALGVSGLPLGATDTMRLDVESVSGSMALARLGDPEKLAEAFDPGRISLVDAVPVSVPSAPRAVEPIDTAVHLRPAVTVQQGAPHSTQGTSPAAATPTTGSPDWQRKLDQGIAAVTATAKEASARFLVWYGTLRQNEQVAFVAGTVLGMLIVLMLFILWVR